MTETFEDELPAHIAESMKDPVYAAVAARGETLIQIAEWTAAVRQINPFNGDGSNHTLDHLLKKLDQLYGSDIPTRAAEDAWDKRMDAYEQEYYGGDGHQRQDRRKRDREAMAVVTR